ncbi:esterase-like activity of phytase family protein [Niabella yanshanensis]|uniref:Esterase-like activity of phytase family protein n=1 Tax=Niabella yanshanensis TaxID=577386 RepID=A0ABZ0W804_9BACT|nr:esterase-like activity of phytase family protein [Niabella yanshanensis]WQD39410.1 esterase-like activity of phytase family protein [Niabella yanshanensis]
MRHLLFIGIFIATFCSSCNIAKQTAKSDEGVPRISSLNFLDEYVIPYDLHLQNTWVGGLSGIDYDVAENRYFIISDERSATSAARFYTAAIDINNYKIDSVRFLSVETLKNAQNDTFPALKILPEHAADPESIRYNKKTKTLVWSSEGDKAIRSNRMVYQNPWIYEMDLKGRFKDSFLVPANLHMYKGDSGARENDVLEGLSFSLDYRYLWASMEGAIHEDGPLATASYANAPVRFTKFDVTTKKAIRQYGYLLDAIAAEPIPATAFSINGIPEILNIGENRFLVLERSFSTGVENCVIKIYLADFSKATDVSTTTSLYRNTNYKPAVKKLLFNFNSLERYIDNVEGITLGPVLPNGHRSLILVADNNFNIKEKQQVFLFEIIP